MLYRALELTVSPTLRVIYQPDVVGFEHVPRTGPVIIAGNHVSFADEIFTPVAARRQVFYFAKAEYFNTPGSRAAAWRPCSRRCASSRSSGPTPVRRRHRSTSVSRCSRTGRRSASTPKAPAPRTGGSTSSAPGVARLALRSGAPVVPVGLIGTREVKPPTGWRWHRRPLGVHFGPPLDFSGRAADERSARALREVAEQIRVAVQALSGPGLRRPLRADASSR